MGRRNTNYRVNVSAEGIYKQSARPGTWILSESRGWQRAWMMKYLPESPISDTDQGRVHGL
jgi:hypothetical protein